MYTQDDPLARSLNLRSGKSKSSKFKAHVTWGGEADAADERAGRQRGGGGGAGEVGPAP